MKFILMFICAIVILFLIFKIVYCLFFEKKNNTFDIYFGVPGSGKTTFAAWLTKKCQKNKRDVYSTVPIKGTYQVEKDDIGYYDISDGLLCWDEAGVDCDNRNYKSNFSPKQVKWLKYHRHYNVDIACFSQYWNDIDIKLRNLATRLFLVQKSFIPFFVKRREIGKRIGIDEQTKQIIDEYYFVPFSTKRIFCKELWKMFNSHEREELPRKDFKKYE